MSSGAMSGSWVAVWLLTELDLLATLSLWRLAPLSSGLMAKMRNSHLVWTMVSGMCSGAMRPSCGAFSELGDSPGCSPVR